MKHISVVAICFGLFIFELNPVWGQADKAGGAGGSIHVGAILPFTGPISLYGTEEGRAIQLALEEFNTESATEGLKITVDYRDDGFKPDRTVSEFRGLVSDASTVAVIGALTSNCTLAIAPLAQDARIPVVTPSSTNDMIIGSGAYLFQACYRDGFQGDVAARFAFSSLKSKTVAVLYNPTSEYSIGLMQAFSDRFKALGGNIVAIEYQSDSTDFSDQAEKVRSVAPDSIFLTDYLHPLAEITKSVRSAGVTVPFIGTDSWDEVVANNTPNFEGSYFVNHYWVERHSPVNEHFVAAYQTRWGVKPDTLAALGYDAAKMVFLAIRRASHGSGVSRESVKNEIGQIDGEFVTGHIRYGKDRNTVKTACVFQVQTNSRGSLESVFLEEIQP